MRCGFMIDGKIFPDRVQGEQRTDALRQHIDQNLYRREVADMLQIPDIFSDQPLQPLNAPASQKSLVLFQQRLRKTAEFPQQIIGFPETRIGGNKWDFLIGNEGVFFSRNSAREKGCRR